MVLLHSTSIHNVFINLIYIQYIYFFSDPNKLFVMEAYLASRKYKAICKLFSPNSDPPAISELTSHNSAFFLWILSLHPTIMLL